MADAPELFRREALDHHAAAMRRDGSVLRIHPGWVGPAYWLLLALAGAGLAVVLLVDVRQYASGPAVVRVEDRTSVTAVRAGTVAAVLAAPGQRVRAGDVLVRLDDAAERVALRSTLREIELQTRTLLLDLANSAARQSLAALQAQRQLLEGEIEQRLIRSPHDGTVSDVRVRAGQHLAPGDLMLSLAGPETRFYVVALLPGHTRPQLADGGPLRLELAGYRYAYQHLTIESVSDEVVGPVEARRYLGAQVADALALSGSVVLVRARLPGPTFTADDGAYHFYDGMQGTAEARTRSERIILALLPGLRSMMSFLDG